MLVFMICTVGLLIFDNYRWTAPWHLVTALTVMGAGSFYIWNLHQLRGLLQKNLKRSLEMGAESFANPNSSDVASCDSELKTNHEEKVPGNMTVESSPTAGRVNPLFGHQSFASNNKSRHEMTTLSNLKSTKKNRKSMTNEVNRRFQKERVEKEEKIVVRLNKFMHIGMAVVV